MSDAPRVLCIDDEPELLKIAKQFLERGGAFTVDTLTSATVALEQLKTNHYDAIVADYAMPDMDGIVFLKALKEMGNTTPVIIFTGRGREDVVIEALNNGADFYLQKGGYPLAHFTELSKMVHYAVSRKRAEIALQEAYDNLEIQVNERTIQLLKTNRGLLEEIEEREKTEEKLRETEATIRALMDSPVDSMIILDRNGIIIDLNPTFATRVGRGIDELIGTNTYDLFSPDLANNRRAQVEEVLRLGVPIRFEDKRGDMWLDQSIHPIFDAENNVVKIAIVARDITERKRVEEALHLANKKLALLTSITRHDINNQLTALRGYLTLLEKNRSGSPKDEYIQKASNAAQRIFAMIQFSKGYEQIGVQAQVWQECHTLVDNTAKEIQFGTILVKNDIPVGMEVFADPLIAKVFYNLMDNAVRYGEKIRSIRFLTKKRNNDCILICEDNGVGVLTGYKDKIFEQDFGKNTGLGLFLSREILSITGITITETGKPGKGARFEMTVPEGLWRFKHL